MCVCVYISVFACICKYIYVCVLMYISLDSALERQCVILSISAPWSFLVSYPLSLFLFSHPPTSASTIGFFPPALLFQVAYGSSPTLSDGCPSFLTSTGRPTFPDDTWAGSMLPTCDCSALTLLLSAAISLQGPPAICELILLILRFSLFKIRSIICK